MNNEEQSLSPDPIEPSFNTFQKLVGLIPGATQYTQEQLMNMKFTEPWMKIAAQRNFQGDLTPSLQKFAEADDRRKRRLSETRKLLMGRSEQLLRKSALTPASQTFLVYCIGQDYAYGFNLQGRTPLTSWVVDEESHDVRDVFDENQTKEVERRGFEVFQKELGNSLDMVKDLASGECEVADMKTDPSIREDINDAKKLADVAIDWQIEFEEKHGEPIISR